VPDSAHHRLKGGEKVSRLLTEAKESFIKRKMLNNFISFKEII